MQGPSGPTPSALISCPSHHTHGRHLPGQKLPHLPPALNQGRFLDLGGPRDLQKPWTTYSYLKSEATVLPMKHFLPPDSVLRGQPCRRAEQKFDGQMSGWTQQGL